MNGSQNAKIDVNEKANNKKAMLQPPTMKVIRLLCVCMFASETIPLKWDECMRTQLCKQKYVCATMICKWL